MQRSLKSNLESSFGLFSLLKLNFKLLIEIKLHIHCYTMKMGVKTITALWQLRKNDIIMHWLTRSKHCLNITVVRTIIVSRFMWVYHLGGEDESPHYLSDIEIQKGEFKSTYSGPVFSLLLSQNKVVWFNLFVIFIFQFQWSFLL